MTAVHPAQLEPRALQLLCEVRRQRRSGPGGQHRNKVETAVVLVHRASGLRGEASERRSQDLNHKMALFRLRVKLAIHLRTDPFLLEDWTPSELWLKRVRGRQIQVSVSHDDFPALLAEAADVLAACEFEPKQAALHLGCTSSQLVRFLKQEPEAMLWVNEQRGARNLSPLK